MGLIHRMQYKLIKCNMKLINFPSREVLFLFTVNSKIPSFDAKLFP